MPQEDPVPSLPVLVQQHRTIRIPHWVNAAWADTLLISGIAILIAHPRFDWGEGRHFGEAVLKCHVDHDRRQVAEIIGATRVRRFAMPQLDGGSRSS